MENNLEQIAAQQKDCYAEHLAIVDTTNEVTANEDIRNDRGVLIARAGTRIDRASAAKIVSHKLAKPLEQQVRLKESLDGKQIYQHLQDVLEKHPDIRTIYDAHKFDVDCNALLLKRDLHPLLIQKLTVMKMQMPACYEKALMCAMLSALISKQMCLEPKDQRLAFLAGLVHDVGFLHISPSIVNKTERLTADEWRSMQCHVIIGQIFLQNIPGVDPRISRITLEHHERCDGTGYPTGKMNADIDVLSKVVAMADSLQAIRTNQFARSGRNLRDALTYLQMNDITYSSEVYRAMCAILKASPLTPTIYNELYATTTELAQSLYKRSLIVQQVTGILYQLLEKLITTTQHLRNSTSQLRVIAVVNHVITKIISAGLNGDQMRTWLAGAHDDHDEQALIELNEIELMQNEIFWHLKNLCKASDTLLSQSYKEDKSEPVEQIRLLVEKINQSIKEN